LKKIFICLSEFAFSRETHKISCSGAKKRNKSKNNVTIISFLPHHIFRNMAAQINVFKIIGDSNTRNAFSTRLKMCERITGQTTEFISASAYSSGMVALSDLSNSTVVYISFLTNGIVDATELCTDLLR